MLRELFAPAGGAWNQHIVQHLRWEIQYFAAARWLSADEQVAELRRR